MSVEAHVEVSNTFIYLIHILLKKDYEDKMEDKMFSSKICLVDLLGIWIEC